MLKSLEILVQELKNILIQLRIYLVLEETMVCFFFFKGKLIERFYELSEDSPFSEGLLFHFPVSLKLLHFNLIQKGFYELFEFSREPFVL